MSERLAYDPAVSQEVQATLSQVSLDVENLIAQRGVDVTTAMDQIEAGTASDSYTEKEIMWAEAATEVKEIIKSVEKTLEKYDNIADQTLRKADDVIRSI